MTLKLGTTSPQKFAEFSGSYDSNGNITTATITYQLDKKLPGTNINTYQPSETGGDTFVTKTTQTEVGHGMGLQDVPCSSDPNTPNCGFDATSVMQGFCGVNDTGREGGCVAANVTDCDKTAVSNVYNPPPPPPSGCTSNADCPCSGTCESDGTCTLLLDEAGNCSPIIIAVGSDSTYQLTSPQGGVLFDIDGNGVREWMAWTRAGDDIAFLVRDRNGNGLIDDGTELFGNHSILPSGERVTNGFEALAYYDRLEYGGNGDGVVDAHDTVWSQLRLWIDWNHNGFSEPEELYSLGDFDVRAIPTTFDVTNHRDAYGNVFRLRAACQMGAGVRQAYDVYFSAQPQRRPE